jgi:hypothetical protein
MCHENIQYLLVLFYYTKAALSPFRIQKIRIRTAGIKILYVCKTETKRREGLSESGRRNKVRSSYVTALRNLSIFSGSV